LYRRGFYPITRVMADLWSRIAPKDREKARSLLFGWDRSSYLLVRRLNLFATRFEPSFTAGEAWTTLESLENEMFWGREGQVEIMRLAAGRCREFGAAEREAFEARITAGPPRELSSAEAFRNDEAWKFFRDSAVFKRLTRLRESGWPITPDSQVVLNEIATRRPEWTPGPEDQDDFAVWHESGWGHMDSRESWLK
jgi:hypothetical protein